MLRASFGLNLLWHLRLQVIFHFLFVHNILLMNTFALGETNTSSDSEYSPANKSVRRRQLSDLELYLKGVNDSLSARSLEYLLDYYEKDLLKEYDFDPFFILKQLVGSAQLYDLTPEQFHEDIKDLIVLHRRLTVHPEKASYSSRKSAIGIREINGNLTNGTELHEPHTTEGRAFINWENDTLEFEDAFGDVSKEDWVKELRLLEKKYKISPAPKDSNSVTHARLAMMFPHHAIMGELRLEPISLLCNGKPCNLYADANKYFPDTVFPLPSNVFQRAEFGGLIPRPGGLRAVVRKSIIAVHLQSHTRMFGSKAEVVPFRAQSVLLKWRIEKSVLSDERRVRLLQNYDILTENRELRSTTSEANQEISDDVRNSIYWQLLENP